MDIVVVMDGPGTVVPATDTSFGLMTAARERGHRCWHCGPSDLTVVDGTVRARVRPVGAEAHQDDPLGLGSVDEVDLRAVDVVLVRLDPPFDRRYLHLTHVLDVVCADTLVVNSPRALRDANEKLYALRFAEVAPPTIVTADREMLRSFAREHDGAVIKPVDGHGGRGVLVVRDGDLNAASILDSATARGTVPVVAQPFLAGVREGDKRILLLDGEPLGAVNRLPADTDFRANICVGGEAESAALDDDDFRIIDTMRTALCADGLVFVGIDVIEGQLIEVNVTSPTGLRQLCELSGVRHDLAVVRWLEQRVQSGTIRTLRHVERRSRCRMGPDE